MKSILFILIIVGVIGCSSEREAEARRTADSARVADSLHRARLEAYGHAVTEADIRAWTINILTRLCLDSIEFPSPGTFDQARIAQLLEDGYIVMDSAKSRAVGEGGVSLYFHNNATIYRRTPKGDSLLKNLQTDEDTTEGSHKNSIM